MAEFSRLVITNKGQALLAKMMTGEGNVEFTKISTSDMEYTLEQLEALTEFSGVKQTVSVAKVTRTNGVAVTIETTFDNTELTEGYHMRALGLYAIDPDDGEILYAVATEMSSCCYMPAYNGVTVSGACIRLVTTVGNAENVSLEVDPGVYATVGEIKELRECVDGIETWKDNTQKRLDNWGPTIIGHGQVINSNKDRIMVLDNRMTEAEQDIVDLLNVINPKMETITLSKPITIAEEVMKVKSNSKITEAFRIDIGNYYVYICNKNNVYDTVNVIGNNTAEYSITNNDNIDRIIYISDVSSTDSNFAYRPNIKVMTITKNNSSTASISLLRTTEGYNLYTTFSILWVERK